MTDQDESETLPEFDQTLAWMVFDAKEALVAPLRPIFRDYNLTEAQWRAIWVINDRRIIDATGLAEAAMLHPTSVSRILRDLEKRKLIMRQPIAGDRRRNAVALSPEGRELVRTLSWHVLHFMHEQSKRFDSDRVAHLVDELMALKDAIKDVK